MGRLKEIQLEMGEVFDKLSSSEILDMLDSNRSLFNKEELSFVVGLMNEKYQEEKEAEEKRKARNKEYSRRYRARQQERKLELEIQLGQDELAKKRAEYKLMKARMKEAELMALMTPQQRWRYKKKLAKQEEEFVKQELLKKQIQELAKQKKNSCEKNCGRCGYFVGAYEAKSKGFNRTFCMNNRDRETTATSERCFMFSCSRSKASKAKLKFCKDCQFK